MRVNDTRTAVRGGGSYRVVPGSEYTDFCDIAAFVAPETARFEDQTNGRMRDRARLWARLLALRSSGGPGGPLERREQEFAPFFFRRDGRDPIWGRRNLLHRVTK